MGLLGMLPLGYFNRPIKELKHVVRLRRERMGLNFNRPIKELKHWRSCSKEAIQIYFNRPIKELKRR